VVTITDHNKTLSNNRGKRVFGELGNNRLNYLRNQKIEEDEEEDQEEEEDEPEELMRSSSRNKRAKRATEKLGEVVPVVSTGTKTWRDSTTDTLLNFFDKSTVEKDELESRMLRRGMTAERKLCYLSGDGVKFRVNDFIDHLTLAADNQTDSSDSLFQIHCFKGTAIKSLHLIQEIPIIKEKSKLLLRLFLKGCWHGENGNNIATLNLQHFLATSLNGTSSRESKNSLSLAIRHFGILFSIVFGLDYNEEFLMLENQVTGNDFLQDKWKVNYLRERVECCLRDIFIFLRTTADSQVFSFLPGTNTKTAEGTKTYVEGYIRLMKPADLMNVILTADKYKRWEGGGGGVKRIVDESTTIGNTPVVKKKSALKQTTTTTKKEVKFAEKKDQQICKQYLLSNLNLGKGCGYGSKCIYEHPSLNSKKDFDTVFASNKSSLEKKGSYDEIVSAIKSKYPTFLTK
jgi:hypothetical protein